MIYNQCLYFRTSLYFTFLGVQHQLISQRNLKIKKKIKIKLPTDSQSDGEQRVIKESKEKSSTTKSSQKIKKDEIKKEQLTKPNFAESTSAAEILKKS